MPRTLRIEYAGAMYHVMSHANGTGDVFYAHLNPVRAKVAEAGAYGGPLGRAPNLIS